MFIEIRLCSPMTYDFKGHVKIDEIYMVKFNVSISNSLQIMGFIVNSKYIHKNNVISNKTVTKLFTILTKCFFPYLNPTSYLKKIRLISKFMTSEHGKQTIAIKILPNILRSKGNHKVKFGQLNKRNIILRKSYKNVL